MSSPFDDYGLAAVSEAGPSIKRGNGGLTADASVEERIEGLSFTDEPRPDHSDGSAGRDGRVEQDGFWYKRYRTEAEDLDNVIRLVEAELSEPYNREVWQLWIRSMYTFRYFLTEWPHLAFLVYPDATDTRAIGVIVCKTDSPLYGRKKRGYIAMLSIEPGFRRMGIASHLVKQSILGMHQDGVREVVIETESDNSSSLALYDKLGFKRDKRLHRFYSNGKDAYRLILPLTPSDPPYPSSTFLFSPPRRLSLPSHPLFPSLTPSTDTDRTLEDEYEETASEVSYGRWEVASGPEWLETLDEHEAYLRGLGGEPGQPEPAPEGAQWMLGELMRARAEVERRAYEKAQAAQAQGTDEAAPGNGHQHEAGLVGDRPDTPALKRPDLPPRPANGQGAGHLFDGMYL